MSVDIRNASGQQLATAPPAKPILATTIYEVDEHEIDGRIAQIIAENAAAPGKAAAGKLEDGKADAGRSDAGTT